MQLQMLVKKYADVRDLVQPGDVIAFGGSGFLSHIVKAAGGSNVSHAGAILEASAGSAGPRFIESTVDFKQPKPITHVKISAFEDRCRTYEGEVWWLPLDATVRRRFDVSSFARFMQQADGEPFDIPGGLWVTLQDFLSNAWSAASRNRSSNRTSAPSWSRKRSKARASSARPTSPT